MNDLECTRVPALGYLLCASQAVAAAVQMLLSSGPFDFWHSGQRWHCCSGSGLEEPPAAPGSGRPAPAVAWAPLQHVHHTQVS